MQTLIRLAQFAFAVGAAALFSSAIIYLAISQDAPEFEFGGEPDALFEPEVPPSKTRLPDTPATTPNLQIGPDAASPLGRFKVPDQDPNIHRRLDAYRSPASSIASAIEADTLNSSGAEVSKSVASEESTLSTGPLGKKRPPPTPARQK